MKRYILVCLIAIIDTLVVAQLSTAQSSFHSLYPRRSVLGFDCNFYESGRDFRGRLEYAIDKKSVAKFSVGLAFSDRLHDSYFSPSPVGEFTIGNTGELGPTPLTYFLNVGFDVDSTREIKDISDRVARTTLGFGPLINVGVFKPLEIAPEFGLFPFLGLSYAYRWVGEGVDYSDLDFSNASQSGILSGMLGVELDILPKFSVFGAWEFSFNNAETGVRIGLNFY